MKQLLLTILLLFSSSALAGGIFFDNSAATLPGSGASDNAVGGITAWTNPGNITANDSTFATYNSSTNSNDLSQYLKATNFGFAVSGTINGIVVEIRHAKSHSGGDYKDLVVKLVINGTVSGNNKADTATQWPSSATVATYGSSSDLWGTTPTATDINASNFGCVLQIQDATSAETGFAMVDYFKITVYYTPDTSYLQKQAGFFMKP
ncbi:MAG: hypothetical protein HY231_23940 [Acidobacteria bacterium]|nr:hypothetical protein [Acidobacteriota bacterium]